jgi:hypothetical protein
MYEANIQRWEQIDKLMQTAKPANFGPLVGRLETISAHVLGGYLLDEDVRELSLLFDSALAEQLLGKGGKTLSESEKAVYGPLVASLKQGIDFAKQAVKVQLDENKRGYQVAMRRVNPASRVGLDEQFKDRNTEVVNPSVDPKDPAGLFK